MSNKYAIILAIEEYHDKKRLGKVDYALNDAHGIKNALLMIGYEESNIKFLTNNIATRTTAIEEIKKISNYAHNGETILFYYAGHGFYSDGKNLISCVDTSLSSLHETCVGIQDILGTFNKSKSKQIMLFLDCCHSGLEFGDPLRSPVSIFSTDELKYEYSSSEFLSGFASCKGDEKSIPDSQNKHGVWSHFLIKALSGDIETIYKEGLLFSDRLQKYLLDETLNRAKLLTIDKKTQTPIQFGKNTDKFIVADISEILKQKLIKKASESFKFEQITLVTDEEGYVSSLPGFIKGSHKAPKEISSYHDSWVIKIAHKLLEEEINAVGERLRQILKYKKKHILSTTIEDGVGEIITKDFDYFVKVNQSENEPDCYNLVRSLENFKNTDILNMDEFNQIFNKYFDEIHLNTKQKIDVEKLIEQIEDLNGDVIQVSYDYSDTSICTINIPSISQKILVSKNLVKIISIAKQSPRQLIDEFKNCYAQLELNSIQHLLE